MTETLHQLVTEPALISEEPEAWSPPDAPLDMPCQDIEPRFGGFELVHLLRLLLPGQRI